MVESVSPELGYADLFRMVRNSRLVLSLLVLTGGIVGAVLAFYLPPVYRAEVLLSPAATEAGGGSTLSRLAQQFAPLAGALGGGLDASEGLATKEVRVATLRSRRLTEQFITQRNLLPKLFPEAWDKATGKWKVKDGQPEAPTMGDAVRRFDEKVRGVDEDRRTGLITLAIEWGDRQSVADWANDLVARTNDFLRTRAIDESRRSIKFLEKELENTTVVERRQIIYRLIESKTSEIMMANGRAEYAFVVVDPAVVPDAKRFVRPKRVVIIGIGLLLGLFAGLAVAAVRAMRAGRGSSNAYNAGNA